MATTRNSREFRYGMLAAKICAPVMVAALVAELIWGGRLGGWFQLMCFVLAYSMILVIMAAFYVGQKLDHKEEDRKISRQMSL